MESIVDKRIIKQLLEYNGIYEGDPLAATIWSYRTSWGNWTQAVFWNNYEDMQESPYVYNPRLLWSRRLGLTEEGKKWLEENQ